MNQIRDWDGKCQRCYTPSDTHTMSMFDVSLICMECKDAEQKDPRYKEARITAKAEMKQGNLNFEGIGYPEKS